MLDHVSITVSNLSAAKAFYDAALSALGIVKVGSDHADAWIGYGLRCDAAHSDRTYLPIRLGPHPNDEPLSGTGVLRHRAGPRWTPSGRLGCFMGAQTTGRPGSGPRITHRIMPRSSSTREGTASRRSAITRSRWLVRIETAFGRIRLSCVGDGTLRVRLTKRALCLNDCASKARFRLRCCAPEESLYCASRRSSLPAATATHIYPSSAVTPNKSSRC